MADLGQQSLGIGADFAVRGEFLRQRFNLVEFAANLVLVECEYQMLAQCVCDHLHFFQRNLVQ